MKITILLDDYPLFESGDGQPADTLYRTLAALWCGMTDDDQARFFEEVGKNVSKWGTGAWDMQAHRIAEHLKTCACITDLGRNAVRGIASRLEPAPVPEENP